MINNYISWIIFGALAGWVISRLVPPHTSSEFRTNIAIGIGGAFLAGLLLQIFMSKSVREFNVAILIIAVAAAVIVLAAVKNSVRN